MAVNNASPLILIVDFRPSLILWFFDSRGGFSLGANSTRVPDHVHPSVATWIERTVSRMNAFWGPADKVGRGSIAFMHIPPSVPLFLYVISID